MCVCCVCVCMCVRACVCVCERERREREKEGEREAGRERPGLQVNGLFDFAARNDRAVDVVHVEVTLRRRLILRGPERRAPACRRPRAAVAAAAAGDRAGEVGHRGAREAVAVSRRAAAVGFTPVCVCVSECVCVCVCVSVSVCKCVSLSA